MRLSSHYALENKGNLAVGNALGSNITNIGLVLGSAALISSISLKRSNAIAEIPILILTGVLGAYFILDGELSQLDGGVLLVVLAVYLYWSANSGQQPPELADLEASHHSEATMSKLITMTVVSIAILLIASRALVFGAVSIAEYLGVSDLVIGLTIVAIGTSLPELAAAIAAARQNAHDMIIGNIIGSNVFNILAVLGITGAIQSTQIETAVIWRDFPVMLGITLLMLVFAITKQRFSRMEGAILLGLYLAYLSYLVVSTVN